MTGTSIKEAIKAHKEGARIQFYTENNMFTIYPDEILELRSIDNILISQFENKIDYYDIKAILKMRIIK